MSLSGMLRIRAKSDSEKLSRTKYYFQLWLESQPPIVRYVYLDGMKIQGQAKFPTEVYVTFISVHKWFLHPFTETLRPFHCVYKKMSLLHPLLEFFLNVFTEFKEKIVIKMARTWLLCERPASARHMLGTGSRDWTKFMPQWFIRLPELNEKYCSI